MATSKALATALVLGLALVRLAVADAGHAPVNCQIDSQPKKVVTDAWAALKRSPNDLEPQLAAADALIDQGCYKEAVPILEAGLARRPRSAELQSRLRAARSMLSEERFFEGLGNAQETAKRQPTVMRCTKLADGSACDDALRSKPEDPQQAEKASRAEAKRAVATSASAPPAAPPKSQTGARVAVSGAVTYSNEAAAAQTN